MGGGAAMRSAAKVAGIGVVNSGLRGFTAEHPVTAAVRRTALPVSATTASSSIEDDVSKTNLQHVVSPNRAWSEFDDWEFPCGEEDAFSDSVGSHHMNRLIFGGAPSFVEAKEATSELKDALEMTYLSSNAPTGYGFSDLADPHSGFSGLLETKACITSERTLSPPPPRHAIQAFRVLSESPAAQNVVASIACDPNVWNAVLQNPALQDFIQSQKSSASFLGMNSDAKESVASRDFFNQHSPKSSDASSKYWESNSAKVAEIMQNIKLTVIDMWSSLSDYFQALFIPPSTYTVFPDADRSARIGFSDKALGASFMGLAVMAIVVVILKRN